MTLRALLAEIERLKFHCRDLSSVRARSHSRPATEGSGCVARPEVHCSGLASGLSTARHALVLVIALLLPLLPDAARAEGDMALLRPSRTLTDVFAPDPPVAWREVRRFSATSDCLGRPVSVMCSVDTLMACIHRRSMDHCRSLKTRDVDEWAEHVIGDRPRDQSPVYENFWRYRVYRVYRADRAAGEPPPDPGSRPRAVRVHLRLLSCSVDLQPPQLPGCLSYGILIVTLIRNRDGSWGVIDWDSPRG